MTGDVALSRPLRLATQLTGDRPSEARARLLNAAVHVRIAAEVEDNQDAAVLLRSLVDQLSRFCGAVAVSAPAAIAQACIERDRELHDRPRVHAERGSSAGANALDIFIGGCPSVPGGIATCSDGWTGKVYATGARERTTAFTIANPIGALTAAALTAGEAFLRLIGVAGLRGHSSSRPGPETAGRLAACRTARACRPSHRSTRFSSVAGMS